MVLAVNLIPALISTQKEAAAIYLVLKRVNNERLQNMAGTGMDIVELKFTEWVEDLKKQAEEPVEVLKTAVESKESK